MALFSFLFQHKVPKFSPSDLIFIGKGTDKLTKSKCYRLDILILPRFCSWRKVSLSREILMNHWPCSFSNRGHDTWHGEQQQWLLWHPPHPMDDCLLRWEGQPCEASAEVGVDITNTSSSASEVTKTAPGRNYTWPGIAGPMSPCYQKIFNHFLNL